jgi:hypothetical protein
MACRRSWQGRLTVRASSTNRASWRSGPGQAGGQGQGKLAVRARASWRSGPGQAGGQGQGKLAVRARASWRSGPRQADGQGQGKLAVRARRHIFYIVNGSLRFPNPLKKIFKIFKLSIPKLSIPNFQVHEHLIPNFQVREHSRIQDHSPSP